MNNLKSILASPPLKGETPEQARARRLHWYERAKYYIREARKKKQKEIGPPPS